AGAFLVRYGFDDALARFPFFTFIIAIIISAVESGALPALVVAILSIAAAIYFFVPPVNSFELTPERLSNVSVYAVLAAVIVGAIGVMHAALDRLSAERARVGAIAVSRQTMFQELQHRMANKLQFIQSLLTLERRRVANPEDAAVFDDAIKRLDTMGRIHRQLYHPDYIALPMGGRIENVGRDMLASAGAANIALSVEMPDVEWTQDRQLALALIVTEALVNAIKYAFPDGRRGRFDVRLNPLEADRYELIIQDDGVGAREADMGAPTGSLGTRIIQSLAAQLGGEAAFDGANGMKITISFPG
ncbi:MAG: sensor histidine kinase, partial [Hyphomonadaceae bacterium]